MTRVIDYRRDRERERGRDRDRDRLPPGVYSRPPPQLASSSAPLNYDRERERDRDRWSSNPREDRYANDRYCLQNDPSVSSD